MKEKEKIRCEKCGSTQTYIKFSTNQRLCRSCGFIEELNKEKENKK